MLFGSASRGGRAVSAPLLRKRVDDLGDEPLENEFEVDIIEDSDDNGVILVNEAVMHGMSIRPQGSGRPCLSIGACGRRRCGYERRNAGEACSYTQAVGKHPLCPSCWGLRMLR